MFAGEHPLRFATSLLATLAALDYSLRRRITSCPRGGGASTFTFAALTSALVGDDASDIPRKVRHPG